MRARNLKPNFFKNEDLASLGYEAQLLFAGLWTLADRAGRLEDRPMRIKAEIFPYQQHVDVDAILMSLSKTPEPFILRYDVDSKRYIQIINFEKHQNPHVREPVSSFPAPGQHQSSTSPAGLIPSSPFLTPSNPLADPKQQARHFEQIWAKYPRRLGKKAALRHFVASVKTPQDWLDIQNALDNFVKLMNKEGRAHDFIQYGSTWFFNWRDYVDYKGVETPKAPSGPSVISMEAIQRISDPRAREAAMQLREEKLKDIPQ